MPTPRFNHPLDVAAMTDQQLRRLVAATADVIVLLTCYDELRRRGAPVVSLGPVGS